IAKSAIGEYFVRRAGRLAEKVAQGFRADAFNYLLFLRLVPIFPFWLVNLVPALCGVPLATFVAATPLGIIPVPLAFALLVPRPGTGIPAQQASYPSLLPAGRPRLR